MIFKSSRFLYYSLQHSKLKVNLISRTFCIHHHLKSNPKPEDLTRPNLLPVIDHPEYGKLQTIYKFHHMTKCRVFFKFKYYLPPFFLFHAGFSYLESLETGLSSDLGPLSIIYLLVYVKFLCLNYYLTNLIGFIYMTEDNDFIVSYCDFNGKRIDEKFKAGELILRYEENNTFQRMKTRILLSSICQSTRQKFKINLTAAEFNEEALCLLVGELPFF